ncbi:MAG: UbiD family decarboxylase [Pseudomonadales bacterium]
MAKDLITGPFDSVRDYVAALEHNGHLVRIAKMNQDKYESTAFAYKLMDKIGFNEAPAFLIENTVIGGREYTTPVLGNLYGPLISEAMGFGVADLSHDHNEMYRQAIAAVQAKGGFRGWQPIPPNEIDATAAPVKEVVKSGDDVDLYDFPWIQNNPADAGQYISMGSVITEDEKLGRNVGTYRCQIKSKNKIGVNPEMGQHGWNYLMALKKRGEKVAKVSVVIGADPITFAMSSSKFAPMQGQDELGYAGCLRGKPVDVVKSENTGIMVPAHAEIVIEGEIPLDNMEPEGPYGELYGFMGAAKEANFYMNVKTITHRKNPWVLNAYCGITRGFYTAPLEAGAIARMKMAVPSIMDVHIPNDALGVTIAAVKKTRPGEAMAAGQVMSGMLPIAKVVILVDEDVDIRNPRRVIAALGARWQPDPAMQLIHQTMAMQLDPSNAGKQVTSKVIIDATRQLPEEGGPAVWPALNRTLLEDSVPEAMDSADENWAEWMSAYVRHQ